MCNCLLQVVGAVDRNMASPVDALGDNSQTSAELALVPHRAAADTLAEPTRTDSEGIVLNDDDNEAPYRVWIEGFETGQGRRRPVVFLFTVTHGNAMWPIRRRFRQILLLHQRVVVGLGRSSARCCLPQLPPKATFRSLMCGRHDVAFLQARCVGIQRYMDALLNCIPYVDQCEALRDFLCTVDMTSMGYDQILDLEEALGNVRSSFSVQITGDMVATLPPRQKGASEVVDQDHCVICQVSLDESPDGLVDPDVRLLPCGHEYHFKCLNQWLQIRNACCVCQSVVFVTEPDL